MRPSTINDTGAERPINVFIPRVPYLVERNTNLEPQEVTSRDPTNALIYLDNKTVTGPRNDFLIQEGIAYINNASRIKFIGCSIPNFFIPNVNPNNNNIQFYSSVTMTTYSVYVAEKYYNDGNTLAQAIVDAMNTVSGASGLTFGFAPVAGFPLLYTITSIGGNYYFLPGCSAVVKGVPLWNLDSDTTESNNHTAGPFGFAYTIYVDIVSNVLTRNGKLKTTTTRGRSSIFARTFMGTGTNGVGTWGYTWYSSTTIEVANFSSDPSQVITGIDIQLYDSNGDLLYIPSYLENSLLFEMTFKIEL